MVIVPSTTAPKYDKHPSGFVVGVAIGVGIGIGIDGDPDTDPDPDPDGRQAAHDLVSDIWALY